LRARVLERFSELASHDPAALEAEIERLGTVIRSGHGDPYAGKKLYRESCGRCHRLVDDGGAIGPGLTPHPRRDIASLLLAIVHPNAEIREGFETFVVVTHDGHVLNGFVTDQDEKTMVLRGADGIDVAIAQADIASIERAGSSLMPEGLLEAMTDDDVRNLFAYLRSAQPLND